MRKKKDFFQYKMSKKNEYNLLLREKIKSWPFNILPALCCYRKSLLSGLQHSTFKNKNKLKTEKKFVKFKKHFLTMWICSTRKNSNLFEWIYMDIY